MLRGRNDADRTPTALEPDPLLVWSDHMRRDTVKQTVQALMFLLTKRTAQVLRNCSNDRGGTSACAFPLVERSLYMDLSNPPTSKTAPTPRAHICHSRLSCKRGCSIRPTFGVCFMHKKLRQRSKGRFTLHAVIAQTITFEYILNFRDVWGLRARGRNIFGGVGW